MLKYLNNKTGFTPLNNLLRKLKIKDFYLTGFTPLEINRKNRKNRKNKSLTGFTLIGTIMAVGLTAALIGGIFLMISQSIILVSDISSKHKAVYLAQEGVEIVRNIRDTNWLEGVAWDDGFPAAGAPPAHFEADFDDLNLAPDRGRFLKINGGFYNYELGEETKFKRKITIGRRDLDADGEEEIEIEVKVSWEKRGREFEIVVQKNLHNWQP